MLEMRLVLLSRVSAYNYVLKQVTTVEKVKLNVRQHYLLITVQDLMVMSLIDNLAEKYSRLT